MMALLTMVRGKMTFTEWIEQELESREWKQATWPRLVMTLL